MPEPGEGAGAHPSRSVVFVNRYYRPDLSATSQLLTDLAEDLVADGWRVTVVAGRRRYDDPDAPPLPRREVLKGVRVVRVSGGGAPRGSISRRALGSVGFLGAALAALLRMPRPDVLVAVSDPPLLSTVVAAAGAARRVPMVAWAQDLYPEVAAALGVLRADGLTYRSLHNLASAVDRGCARVVTVGDSMAEVVRRRSGCTRVDVIPNWADFDAIRPVGRDENAFVARHGLEGAFVVLYSGNAGRGHTFDDVLAAASLVQASDARVVFLFVGGGARRRDLEARAESRGLANVRFLDYQPRDTLDQSLGAAHVSLVTEDPRVAGLLVPSKTYGILASGRPVLYLGSAGTDVAGLVREYGCGVVVEPGRPEELAGTVLDLVSDEQKVVDMGRAARAAGEDGYSRKECTRRWSRLLEEVRLV